MYGFLPESIRAGFAGDKVQNFFAHADWSAALLKASILQEELELRATASRLLLSFVGAMNSSLYAVQAFVNSAYDAYLCACPSWLLAILLRRMSVS